MEIPPVVIDRLPLYARALASLESQGREVVSSQELGYQLSVIWNPIDYLRFMAQYGHVTVDGGPRAATVDPDGPLDPSRKYGVDTAAVRAQLEF